MPTTATSLRRVATSPSWWLALTLLVLNDHVLKHAFPGVLTGKLSDFVGLFVAAPLLAAVLGVTLSTRGSRGVRLGAYVATGAVFAAINVSHTAAEVLETLLAWRVWTDPTDLIALPMLVLAWRRFEAPAACSPIVATSGPRIGWSERLAVALGGLACVATSRFPIDVPRPWTGELQVAGLYAETYEDESDRREDIRIRRLLPEVELDCEALATRPEETVTRRLFAPVERWSLGHRELLQFFTGAGVGTGAGTSRTCDVIWLEHDEAGVALVRWSADMAGRVALERNGEAIGWVEEIGSNLIVRRSPRAPIPARSCEPAPIPPSVDGTWPTGTYDTRYALQVEASPDGCTRVTLAEVVDVSHAPAEPDLDDALPELPEEHLRPSTVLYACGYPAELFSVFDGPVRLVGVDPLQLQQLDDDGTLRASLAVSETDASGVPSFLQATRIEECEAANACGEIATPWRVELAPRLDAEWRAEGTGFVSSDGLARVQVLLAQSSVAVDRACVDGVGELGERFVVAYATRVAPEELEPVEDPSEEPSEEPSSEGEPEPSGDDPPPAEEPGGGP